MLIIFVHRTGKLTNIAQVIFRNLHCFAYITMSKKKDFVQINTIFTEGQFLSKSSSQLLKLYHGQGTMPGGVTRKNMLAFNI